ncbi:MAG: hypothetical protein N2747_07290 [Chitinophagaceae bacterium]|nr:hypothetical protein [Chitinophagaceae bacterium]
MNVRILFVLICLTVIFQYGCQKEIDWGWNAAGSRLMMIKSFSANDTTLTEFTYDAGGRLIREKTTGPGISSELIIRRNNSGIITETVVKSPNLNFPGVDSLLIKHNYNNALSRYTSSVFSIVIPFGNLTIKDSAVYAYNSSGRIISEEHHIAITGMPIPIPPMVAQRVNYVYNETGKNIISVQRKIENIPGLFAAANINQTFSFDNKTNPLILQNEAIITGRVEWFNANNIIRTEITNSLNPGQNLITERTYIYNMANKPDTVRTTQTGMTLTTTAKYIYR